MTTPAVRSGAFSGVARSLGSRLRNSSLLVRALSGIPTPGGVILRYHSVSSDSGWAGDYLQESLVVRPDVFDRQLALLTRRHKIVGVGEIVKALLEGSPVDRRTVAITFDDGYEDNYRVALPILLRHDATATFYITTGAISDRDVLWPVKVRRAVRCSDRAAIDLSFIPDGPVDLSTPPSREAAVRRLTGGIKSIPAREARDAIKEVIEACGPAGASGDRRVLMNEDEIRGMRDAGMTIGAHTVSHFNLPSLESSDVEAEVRSSKATLETILSTEVADFAYPDGRTGRHCDGRVATIVAEQGFRSAVTSIAGAVTGRDSPYGIPRLGVYGRHASVQRLAADIQYARFERQPDSALREIRSAAPGADGSSGAGQR